MADLENDSRFFVQEFDVVSDESVENVVANVIENFGRIDILVNNAGVLCIGPLAELPLSAIQNAFDVNVFGAMRMIQAVVPHMAARKKGKKHSRMPELKLYKPFENIIKERAYFKEPPNATPTEIFARKTVAVLFKDKPPTWFSSGKYSTLVEIYSCMPNFVKDFLARRMMK
ncbi:hypothetical protein Patl1_27361 [Pistacia atlantica]|uniref:Uncharacterized protein n=1 Tax=Pistacia atlantica TaxID=434234 RepID=A0ACC1BH13_9ROSI|nr:hypothetical protein Patl1_27361 [Pistacia atlantica]